MSKQWRLTLVAVVACVLSLAAPGVVSDPGATSQPGEEGAWAVRGAERSLYGVRVELDAQGQPVVTLDSDGPVEFDSFVLDGPDRLVLDLTGVVNRLDTYRYPVDDGGVAQVRAAQHVLEPVPVTRVVFDLVAPVPYTIDRDGSSLTVVFGSGEYAEVRGEPVSAEAAAGEPTFAEPAVDEPDDAPAAVERAAAEIAELESTEPAGVSEMYRRAAELLEADVPTDEAPVETASIEPDTRQAQPVTATEPQPSRSVEPSEIERLLNTPPLAAPAESSTTAQPANFKTKTIVTEATIYTGQRVSLNLVDADIKQVFRLFHEISGLNFVLDPDVSGRVTIVLDQVPWDQALDLILSNNGLDKVVEGNVLRIAPTAKLAREAAARKNLKEAEELEVEPITLTRTLSYAKAADVQRVIREGGVLTTRGKVIVDERTNTLIISDIPKKVEPLDVLISTLDSETPQVIIEARIVETSKIYSRELGIRWGFEAFADAAHGTATGLSFPHNAAVRYGLNLPKEGASVLGFSFSNVVDSFTLDLELDALETEGHGRILSSPKITTQNNERAEIEQGVRIPIVNTTATEINVEFVSASLLLSVTPQITAEGTVILDIVVENNSPDFSNTVGGVPAINTQRAQTKVLISDGGTTVIGGIFVVSEGQSEAGVPWFRKLPLFGWLFKQQEINQQNRELLIFITPKIVKLG
jgi:type IV pilus assembly protein PilQ